jgi:hypothetical protein
MTRLTQRQVDASAFAKGRRSGALLSRRETNIA